MKVLTLLLVSVLVSRDAANPVQHKPLNFLIDLASNLIRNATKQQDHFVEDVQKLVDAGCHGDFFCKVEEVLKGHPNSSTDGRDEMKLLRHLRVYNQKISCTEILKTVKTSSQRKPMSDFLTNIMECSKQNNFNGTWNKTVASASKE